MRHRCAGYIIGAITVALLALGGTATAQTLLTWSGTGASSANQVWGIQASNVMSKYSGVRVMITESAGSAANVEKFRNRRAQLGHVTTDIAVKALRGIDEFAGNPYPQIRTLLMIQLLPLFIAVPQRSGVTRLQDLDGKAFSPGPPGFATSALAMRQFEVLGIKPQWFMGSVADSVNAIKDGKIAGITRAGGVPDSNLSEIANVTPISLLSPSDAELAKLKEAIPTASVLAVRVPAGIYAGVPETNYKQIGFGLLVGSDTQISQAVGYQLVKSVLEHWSEGFGSLDVFKNFGPNDLLKMTLDYASVPLHAGTVQYMREKGHSVPAHLIPEEFKP